MPNAQASTIKSRAAAALEAVLSGCAKTLKKYGPAAFQVALVFGTRAALAQSTTSSGTDDLGGGLCTVINLLMGKWTFGLAMGAMLASMGALLFGAELTDMVKKALTVITGVGFLVAFGGILSMAYTKLASSAC